MVWFVKDGCGIACIILAWFLMAFSQYALLTIVLLPQAGTSKKYEMICFFELLSCLALFAHLRTVFTDPGSEPQNTATPELLEAISKNSPPNQIVYKCAECCSVKPDKAHHCSVCKRCIRKMDHHCPWVNNCVGEQNQKHFVLFLLCVTILSIFALTQAVSHLLNCLDTEWSSPDTTCSILSKSGKPSPENFIMLVLLIFTSLLFALFTAIMLGIQTKAILAQ